MKRLFCLAVLLVSLSGQTAMASDMPDLIQKRYDSLKSFKSTFSQELTNAATAQTDKRSGVISFLNPGQVRWETLEPEKELLLVGRETVWDFIENEHLAIKYKASQAFNSKSMIRFLSGQANLKEDFKVEDQGPSDGFTKIKLIPKEPEPGMVLAFLWVTREGLVRKVLIVDFYGNGNLVSLDKMDLDVKLDQAQFTFSPPKGVDVQDNTKE